MANPLPKSPNYLRGAFPVAARLFNVFRNFKVPSNLTFYLGGNKGNPGSGSGGSGGLTPPAANLWAWYKTSSLSLNNNDPVLGWTDSSGNGRNLIPHSNNPVFETNVLNSKPGIKFNGGVDALINTGITFPADIFSVYVVHKQTLATGDAGSLVALGGVATGYIIMKLSGNKTIVNRAVASMVDAAATTNAELWSVIRSAAPLTTLRINNGNPVALTNDTAANSTPDAGIYLGNFANAAGFNLNGHMFEVLIYNATHDATALAAVRAYISQEWAIF